MKIVKFTLEIVIFTIFFLRVYAYKYPETHKIDFFSDKKTNHEIRIAQAMIKSGNSAIRHLTPIRHLAPPSPMDLTTRIFVNGFRIFYIVKIFGFQGEKDPTCRPCLSRIFEV